MERSRRRLPSCATRFTVRQQARGPYGPQARSPFPPSVSGEMTALTSPNSTITASRAELPPPGTLGIEIRPRRERVVVAPRGELDCGTTDRLEAAVDELLALGWDSIVLDLRGLSFMDSTGLRAILRQANRTEATVKVIDGAPPVARLFDLTGVRGLLEFVQPDGHRL